MGGLSATANIIGTGSSLLPEPNEGSRCAFCDYRGTLTGEHIWPQGLLAALGFPKSAKATVTRGGAPSAWPSTTWTTSAFAGEVRIDCDICNNRKLEAIEKAAKRWVVAMALGGSKGPLDAAAQRDVAAFALRMFAVAQYTNPTNRPIPRDHREFLVEHGEAPKAVRVWLWSYAGANPWSGRIYILPIEVRWPGDEGAMRENAYRGILRVGHLVIEIAASTNARPFPIAPRQVGAHLVIWPPDRPCQAVNWPPALALDEARLQERIDALLKSIEVDIGPPGQ